jgi:hypothetical protein
MPKPERYAVIDEPVASPWTHIAVSPTLPLFGFMLGGAWLGWTWFIVNSHAFGSATRKLETAVALLAPLCAAGLFVGVEALGDRGVLSPQALPYALLVVVLFKLATVYWLYNTQARSFALYEYFGGRRRNAGFVLVLGLLFGRDLLESLPVILQVVFQ